MLVARQIPTSCLPANALGRLNTGEMLAGCDRVLQLDPLPDVVLLTGDLWTAEP